MTNGIELKCEKILDAIPKEKKYHRLEKLIEAVKQRVRNEQVSAV